MSDNRNGRRWARGVLTVALLVSLVGNVAHTYLADSVISLWLRVPGAIVWPAFTFFGIEIVVRMIWERRWTHSIARNMVLGPAVPAAIVSYEHLHWMLTAMGERAFIAAIGPLVIDGMMIGCTMVLLFTRNLPQVTIDPESLNVDAEISRLEAVLAEQQHADALAIEQTHDWDIAEIADVPVSPAPIQNVENQTRKARAKWDASVVIPQIMDGAKKSDIEVPDATYYRLIKVAKALQTDPRAVIDCHAAKVSSEHVHAMRELVGR